MAITIPGLKTGQEVLKVTAAGKDSGKGFDDIMQDALGKISQIQNDADNAIKEIASGGDVVQSIISMEKAEMSFQLMVEIRNRLLSAYEEIMRMQV